MTGRSEISGRWWLPAAGGPGGDRGPGGSRSLPERSGGRPGRAGVGVPAGLAGGGASRATTQRSYFAGAAALVPVHLGHRRPLEPGDAGPRPATSAAGSKLAGKPGRPKAAARAVPGKRQASARFAPTTVAHCETVCRSFYGYRLDAGTGQIVNPFPLARAGGGRTRTTTRLTRSRGSGPGQFRPRGTTEGAEADPRGGVQRAVRRARGRTGAGPWSRSGSRPAPGPREPLGVTRSGADPGQQLITVTRKGSRAVQALPASPDAFVWLRLYQQEVHGAGSRRAG